MIRGGRREQQVREHRVGVGRDEGRAHPDPIRQVGEVCQVIRGGGAADRLAAQLFHHRAVGQHVDLQRRVPAQQAQAVQVAAQLLHLVEGGLHDPLGGEQRHVREPRELQVPVHEEGLAQVAGALQAHQQDFAAAGLHHGQHRGAHQRQRVDAGERHLVLLDALDPGLDQPGVGHRADEQAVVAPALGLAPLDVPVPVGRLPEGALHPVLDDVAPVAAEDVGDGVPAILLLDQVEEHVRGHVGLLFQVGREVREPLVAALEQQRVGQRAPAPLVDGQAAAREVETAPRPAAESRAESRRAKS